MGGNQSAWTQEGLPLEPNGTPMAGRLFQEARHALFTERCPCTAHVSFLRFKQREVPLTGFRLRPSVYS
ncbi:hypothetical protein NQ318_015734 [Aromia moschata]|uniref:Uncharacterized protein n=1 Tax=Aromia moschata TaxID=1265417 RepID=A0AAV8Y0J2_9CUCU|nr:hypothetical protein NQ318_015734 [Aromia moschata]